MNADLAKKCAILYDFIEYTEYYYEDVENLLGKELANDVMALIKNEALEDKEKMKIDNFNRMNQQSKEV